MAKVKMTKEEENAMKIQAMLQGVSFEDLLEANMSAEDDEDDIEIEIEDEKKPKKKGKKKASEDKPVVVQHLVPELEQFGKLNRGLKLNVNYNEHDIPYKEQLWNIPARTIEYEIELVKNPKIAKDIADVFSHGSAEERQKAEDGIVRYFRVINYEENVSHKIKEIAYIRVVEDNGKFRTQLYVKSKLLKENNANPEKVKNNINKIIKNIAA